MNKAELVDAIAERSGFTKAIADKILTEAIAVIVQTVADGDRVTLIGLGSFASAERKEKKGRNPRTGKMITIPAVQIPKFSAGKAFKELVKNG